VRDEQLTSLITFCDELDMPLFVLGADRIRGTRRTVLSFDVISPDRAERQQLWLHALGERADALKRWSRTAGRSVRTDLAGDPRGRHACIRRERRCAPAACQHTSASEARRPREAHHHQRELGRLVLPEREKNTLRDIAVHLAHRGTVHGSWGFSGERTRGSAIHGTLLRTQRNGEDTGGGDPREELGLDLFKIESEPGGEKYIGESEKNLRAHFRCCGGGRLPFFSSMKRMRCSGSRSELKDSHDRYANIDVSYLLQRMVITAGWRSSTTT